MRQAIFGAMALIVLLFIGYVALFKRGEALSWFKKGKQAIKGYTPAKTPDELATRFKEAIKNRDYEAASQYCTGKYSEQLIKGGPGGYKLGRAIDNLMSQMKDRGLTTDEVRIAMAWLDPFPTDIEITTSNESQESADARFTVAGKPLKGDIRPGEFWKLDPRIFNALSRGIPERVKMVKVKEGKDEIWKLDIPVPEVMQASVSFLKDHYMDYVNPLEVMSQEIKTEATTKGDVRGRLKGLLEEAADIKK